MGRQGSWLIILLLGMNSYLISQNKGYCPPASRATRPVPETSELQLYPPTPGMEFAGTVSIFAVISDQGYTCGVQLIRGFDKQTDKAEMRTVRNWHLPPTRQGDHTIPMLMTQETDFWRDAKGELVRGSDRFSTTGLMVAPACSPHAAN